MASADILRKPYARLVIPDEDGTFSAEIVEFPGCIAVGSTAAEALTNLDETAVDWINAALEQGQDIPEPLDSAGYSGKLVLRMPKGLHRKATLFAEREGVSLNQFIVTCLAEAVGERAKPQGVQVMAAFQADARVSLQLIPTPVSMGILGGAPQGVLMPMATGSGKSVKVPVLKALEPEHA